MRMKLEAKHIIPYLIYGLEIQYNGVINGKELTEYDKTQPKGFPIETHKLDEFYRNRPEEIIGVKTAKIKQVRFYNNYIKFYAGTYHRHLKNVYLGEIKPLLIPISKLSEVLKLIYSDFKFQNIEILEMKYSTVVNYTLMGENFKDIVFSQGSFNNCPAYVYNKLIEKKVDVFNLIASNLAEPL